MSDRSFEVTTEINGSCSIMTIDADCPENAGEMGRRDRAYFRCVNPDEIKVVSVRELVRIEIPV